MSRYTVTLTLVFDTPTASQAANEAFDHVKRSQALTFEVRPTNPEARARDLITVVTKGKDE